MRRSWGLLHHTHCRPVATFLAVTRGRHDRRLPVGTTDLFRVHWSSLWMVLHTADRHGEWALHHGLGVAVWRCGGVGLGPCEA
jgi:hypothetical protein